MHGQKYIGIIQRQSTLQTKININVSLHKNILYVKSSNTDKYSEHIPNK